MSSVKSKGRYGDGPRPVIPSECEGSKERFLPSVEMTPHGYFACLASWRDKFFCYSCAGHCVVWGKQTSEVMLARPPREPMGRHRYAGRILENI